MLDLATFWVLSGDKRKDRRTFIRGAFGLLVKEVKETYQSISIFWIRCVGTEQRQHRTCLEGVGHLREGTRCQLG